MTVQRTPETNFEVIILILNSKKKNHFFNSKIAINIELLETAMAAHSSALARRIQVPPSMGFSRLVGCSPWGR